MKLRISRLLICTILITSGLWAQLGQGLPEDEVRPVKVTEKKARTGSPLLFECQGGFLLSAGQNTDDDWNTPVGARLSVRSGDLWHLGFLTLNLGLESGFYTAAANSVSDDLAGIPINLIIGADFINKPGFALSLDQYIGLESQNFIYSSLYPAYGAGLKMTWYFMDNLGLTANIQGRLIFSDETSSYQGSQAWITAQAGLTLRLPHLLP